MILPRPSRATLAAILLTGAVVSGFGVALHPTDRVGYFVGWTVASTMFLVALAVEEDPTMTRRLRARLRLLRRRFR